MMVPVIMEKVQKMMMLMMRNKIVILRVIIVVAKTAQNVSMKTVTTIMCITDSEKGKLRGE